jgi:hypothetical protein
VYRGEVSASFAAIFKGERKGVIDLEDIDGMVTSVSTADYLGPTVEIMFLTDFVQRFWFSPAFMDRGERLECRWKIGWHDACDSRLSAKGVAAAILYEADMCS